MIQSFTNIPFFIDFFLNISHGQNLDRITCRLGPIVNSIVKNQVQKISRLTLYPHPIEKLKFNFHKERKLLL